MLAASENDWMRGGGRGLSTIRRKRREPKGEEAHPTGLLVKYLICSVQLVVAE